ncbi:MAG: LapA family protein [Acetobacteraceae bacterium]|nr:LapA family protein [Acetobacteraceae bacterium]MCX7683783.1 LapA family protein [Acetobacteraceae bacterium]MDW8397086.1 LapA family protein [Acetobacteraceae bacterium]
MLRALALLPFGALIALVVLFALSNPQEVGLRLWPFDLVLVAPLSLAVLAVAGLAFLLGAAIASVSNWPVRRRLRRAEQASRRLEAELQALRAQDAAARP